MLNDPHNLGELHSVHRPSVHYLLILSFMTLVPLSLLSFSLLITFTGANSKNEPSGFDLVLCNGALVLLLLVIGALWVSEFRAWSRSRTVKLSLYQNGFTFENKDTIQTCRWEEIKHLRYRNITVVSKSLRRSVKVIRSIVKKDDTVINLPETLKLETITKIITSSHSGSGALRAGTGEL